MYDVLTIEDWIRRLYAVYRGVQPQQIWMGPYGYVYDVAALAAVAGTNTGTLAINSNADFVLTRINYAAQLASSSAQTTSTKAVAQVTANIVDTGNATPFFASPVRLENLAANQYPNRFCSYPRFLSANTTLSINLLGVGTTAETYALQLMFEGINVREASPGMFGSSLGA